MYNEREKSLLQKFEEAAAKPVPYEGLASTPVAAGIPMARPPSSFEKYEAQKGQRQLVVNG